MSDSGDPPAPLQLRLLLVEPNLSRNIARGLPGDRLTNVLHKPKLQVIPCQVLDRLAEGRGGVDGLGLHPLDRLLLLFSEEVLDRADLFGQFQKFRASD